MDLKKMCGWSQLDRNYKVEKSNTSIYINDNQNTIVETLNFISRFRQQLPRQKATALFYLHA